MEFKQLEHRATKLFNRYGAGIRQGTSPTLIHRFVAGLILRIPLITFEELEEQLKQAEQEANIFKAFQGIGKRPGVYQPYVHISNYLKKCFEAAGWGWSPCTSPFDSRLKNEHRKKARNRNPRFPTIENELKRNTYPKRIFEQNRSGAPENLPSILLDGIGKLPPPLSARPPDGLPNESRNKEQNHHPENPK